MYFNLISIVNPYIQEGKTANCHSVFFKRTYYMYRVSILFCISAEQSYTYTSDSRLNCNSLDNFLQIHECFGAGGIQ